MADDQRGPPSVYFRRVAVFIIGLALFFAVVSAIFHTSNKRLLDSESLAHLNRIADLISDQLTGREQELAQRLTLVHNNVLLQEYMFVVSQLEGDPASLIKIYRQQVNSLPRERGLLITVDGTGVIGGEHEDLLETVSRIFPKTIPTQPQLTHAYIGGTLEVMGRVGMFYKGEPMGQVVFARPLDERFMQVLKQRSGGDLFLVSDGKILQSTLGPTLGTREFKLKKDFLKLNSIPYRFRRILLEVTHRHGGAIPELWIGVNQQVTQDFLQKFMLASLAITLFGAAAALSFGMYLIQKIVKPIENLVELTQTVANGDFPETRKVRVHDEMDYLASGFYSMVSSLKEQREKIESVNKQLQQEAITDALTGLYNRRYFDAILPQLHSLFSRENRSLFILMLDIDFFKRINDTYGHDCGDAILIRFAETLRISTRKSDFRFRIGGEEFVLLFTAEDITKAFAMADTFRQRVMNDVGFYKGATIHYTISIGLVEAMEGVSPLKLLRLADEALFAAKKGGRNQVHVKNN